MKIGILGTGMVGETFGTKLVGLKHEVMMGSRDAHNANAKAWSAKNGRRACHGTFADAAAFGEIIFNCINGEHALEALNMADERNLSNKILIDVSNPLDFSKGLPPTLFVSNTDSLGEQIQHSFPRCKVVKALNTLSCGLTVNPSLVPGDHNLFICSNDEAAREQVTGFICENFGWKSRNIIDLGNISNARATESILPLWLRLWGKLLHPNFNFHVVIGHAPKV